jgi:hypothetical protein
MALKGFWSPAKTSIVDTTHWLPLMNMEYKSSYTNIWYLGLNWHAIFLIGLTSSRWCFIHKLNAMQQEAIIPIPKFLFHSTCDSLKSCMFYNLEFIISRVHVNWYILKVALIFVFYVYLIWDFFGACTFMICHWYFEFEKKGGVIDIGLLTKLS